MGPQVGWMPIPSSSSSVPSPSPTTAPPLCHAFTSLLLFPSHLNTARRLAGNVCGCPHCPQNNSQLQKLEGTKYTWSPRSPKLERTRPTSHIGRYSMSMSTEVRSCINTRRHNYRFALFTDNRLCRLLSHTCC